MPRRRQPMAPTPRAGVTMADPELTGGCLCGAVRYRITAAPVEASVCHCRSCRRGAGAEAVAWATVPKAEFELAGTLARFASSPGIARGFCPTCGTSVTFDDGGETIDVTVASLDDPEAIRPDREVWLEHRLSWVAVDSSRARFPRGS
jgi:hypothetical protein